MLVGSSIDSLVGLISLQRSCPGAIVSKAADIPPLRFCTVIEGNLSLVVSDSTAKDSDYAIFIGLEEIKGIGLIGK